MSNAQLPQPSASSTDFNWLLLRFGGRIDREVYWLSIIFLWSALFVIVSALIALLGEEGAGGPVLILGIASLWPEMAVLVKRQHDRGLPWFWCLLAFVPVAGIVWMIAMGAVPGEPGPNSYGRRTNAAPRD